jgi:hypothetical protein
MLEPHLASSAAGREGQPGKDLDRRQGGFVDRSDVTRHDARPASDQSCGGTVGDSRDLAAPDRTREPDRAIGRLGSAWRKRLSGSRLAHVQHLTRTWRRVRTAASDMQTTGAPKSHRRHRAGGPMNSGRPRGQNGQPTTTKDPAQ